MVASAAILCLWALSDSFCVVCNQFLSRPQRSASPSNPRLDGASNYIASPYEASFFHRPALGWTVEKCSSCTDGLYKGKDKNGLLRSNEDVFLGLNPNGISEKTDVGIVGHVTLCFPTGIRHHGGGMEEAVSGVGRVVLCRLMKMLCGRKKMTKRE